MALADPAGHVDLTIALIDQSIDHREAQACTQTLVLGGIEQLEDSGQTLVVDTAVIVVDSETDVLIGLEIEEPTGQRSVKREGCCLNSELSAMGHGVARVDRQVNQRLVKLFGVGFDLVKAGA